MEHVTFQALLRRSFSGDRCIRPRSSIAALGSEHQFTSARVDNSPSPSGQLLFLAKKRGFFIAGNLKNLAAQTGTELASVLFFSPHSSWPFRGRWEVTHMIYPGPELWTLNSNTASGFYKTVISKKCDGGTKNKPRSEEVMLKGLHFLQGLKPSVFRISDKDSLVLYFKLFFSRKLKCKKFCMDPLCMVARTFFC